MACTGCNYDPLQAFFLLHSALRKINANLKMEKNHPAADDRGSGELIYTFITRNVVKFSAGTPLTASDAVFTFNAGTHGLLNSYQR